MDVENAINHSPTVKSYRNHSKRGRSLLSKLSDSYHGRYTDPQVTKASLRAAVYFYWFTCISELYVCVTYLVPYHFEHWAPYGRYLMKVFCWFVFIQSSANWLCLRFFDSIYRENTRDRPKFEQLSTWERHIAGVNGCCEVNGRVRKQNSGPGSWHYCSRCERWSPPRTHHCTLCNQCILKRDHHCYMTGVCIGYYNQRYFIMLNFYIAIASLVGLYFIWLYFIETMYNDHSTMTWFLPLTIWSWFLGELHFHHVLITCHMYTLWWTGLTALCFFSWQMMLVCLGKTDYEFRRRTRVTCTTSVADNFRSVFGLFWPVNFVFPAVIVFRQEGDGKHWIGLKAH